MIRLSIGIENIDDILWDINQTLVAAQRPRGEEAGTAGEGEQY